MLTLILFVLGFFILVKGSDFLIDGARSVAKKLKISDWIIGTTIVGIGTSVPEFSIIFLSALRAEVDIGLGTIIGSDIFNILLILGLVALIYPIRAKPRWVRQDLTANILAILIAAVLAVFPVIGGGFFEISKGEGLILLILFLIWIFHEVLKNGADKTAGEKEPSLKILSFPFSFLMIAGGLVGVFVGAEWVIDGAKLLARYMGVSEATVGLTIVGIGTSLPELVVSLRAAHRKNFGISLGNIVGSNIFDFLGILGVAASFGVLAVPRELLLDLTVALGAAALLLVMMLSGVKYVLQRWQGAIMVSVYILYLLFII